MRKGLIVIGLASMGYFLLWWIGYYHAFNPLIQLTLGPAAAILLAHFCSTWTIFWHGKKRRLKPTESPFKVDVYVPCYNEPREMVEKTLTAALAIQYPHETYLLDDSDDGAYRDVALSQGAKYISRGNNRHYKAGNINNALTQTQGDFIAVFDIDHVPQPDFLDHALEYFRDVRVGFVQVMLSHSNRDQSFVAGAAADQTYEIFGPFMMGVDGMGCVSMFGSNSIIRRKALQSIGGYRPGLTDDVQTSLQLHAAGWRSIYIPKVLAKGLVPADLVTFFQQQLKWSRGLLDVLIQAYPRLRRKLTAREHLGYLTRLTVYLIGPAIAIHLMLLIYLLYFGSAPEIRAFQAYIQHLLPLAVVSTLIRRSATWHLNADPDVRRSSWRGPLLYLGTWPLYVYTAIAALTRRPWRSIGYNTPKERQLGNFTKWLVPQIITVAILSIGILIRVMAPLEMATLVLCMVAALAIAAHGGVFYGAVEGAGKPEPTPSMVVPRPLAERTDSLFDIGMN